MILKILDHQTGQMLHVTSWVSVQEALPDDGMAVLVYMPDESEPVWIGYMDVDHWRCAEGGIVAPTHWMPLPEAPTESR